MKLEEFIHAYVTSDPEWREAYEKADATREAARALARARRLAGLSQTELAERSGTAQAVISRIERGTVSPSLDTLSKIAKGLGMRPIVALEPLAAGGRAKKKISAGATPGSMSGRRPGRAPRSAGRTKKKAG